MTEGMRTPLFRTTSRPAMPSAMSERLVGIFLQEGDDDEDDDEVKKSSLEV